MKNCPYCREEYNKKATIDHYQALLRSANRNMLAGVDLAMEIMSARPIMKSSILIEDIKD
jgi:hypothetical protein